MLGPVLQFFSLETLDTRLFPPANAAKRQSIINSVDQKSRWSTLEFKFYLLVFVVVVPLMYKTAMDASNETNPNYPRFAHLLSPGWLFGRQVDNSDQQYRFFRDNFFLLVALIVGHCLVRRIVTPLLRIQKRTWFDFGFGLFFLFVAHGTNSVKIVMHLLVSYAIGRFVPSKNAAVAATWIYGILTLFLNDQFRNVLFGVLFLDSGFKGIVARWDVFFNFTLLRMISYNLDYLEKLHSPPASPKREDNAKEEASSNILSYLDDRQRLTAPIPLSDFNIFNYIAYITYTPLFIAGPILTYNDYIYQSNYYQLPSVKDYHRTFVYLCRLAFCVLVMEFLLHFMYVVAVSKTKAWAGDTPFQISMLGMFNLNIIWLKLLIPWRLFRFWALLDGIDPPENMIRCMDNNYLAVAFWRAWHRSYNRWVVRYIYVPLGGSGKFRIVANLCVFTFVAVWHDIQLRLLMWGWTVVLFLVPEIAATAYFKRYEHEWWFRYLCGLGAVGNIWMMMLANLFGFCLGKDGVEALLKEMFSTVSGFEFFLMALGALFVGSQVMFELRESEKRKGINVRC